MLLEFRIENYRSIKDEQCLSFVASDEIINDNKTNCSITNSAEFPYILNSSALYGPNASGKSNTTFALTGMKTLVLFSTKFLTEQFIEHYTPFSLDIDSSKKPTSFEISLIINQIFYRYGFSYDSQKIHKEWLYDDEGEKLFERHEQKWTFSDQFEKNNKTLRQTWAQATRTNALFLTTAAQLNCDQLRPLYNWFEHEVIIIPANSIINISPTIQKLGDTTYKNKILELLKSADIHIDDVRMKEKPETSNDIEFGHKTEDGSIIWFDRRFESLGTQRLLALGDFFFNVLETGKFIVIDEIENSLHPVLVEFIINQFHNPGLNKHAAQLCMITHNTSLLSANLFRKDQIWFIKKDHKQATCLYPLTDFKSRESENLEKNYLTGRYGALPFIYDQRSN